MAPTHNIPNNLPAFRLMVYRKALRPKYFTVEKQINIRHSEYKLVAWIARGEHMIRFFFNEQNVVEAISAADRKYPDAGQLTSVPCAGERDFQTQVGKSIGYIASAQTEVIAENLYCETLQDMQAQKQEDNTIFVEWPEPDSRHNSLSMLSLQRYRGEIHTQSWHLDATTGLILRTQTIFEELAPADVWPEVVVDVDSAADVCSDSPKLIPDTTLE